MDTLTELTNREYLLEKFQGKGGWTFARIPEVNQSRNNPFGWVKVRGSIDGVEIRHYHLMPMGDGSLFMPVKAAIRKKIGKQEGDSVHIVLYLENEILEIPEVLLEILENYPLANTKFNKLPDGEKKRWIDHIFQAKKEETQSNRIVALLNQLER